MTFSDTTLRTYLDGTAPDDLRAQIEADLARNPALESRLMALDPLAGLVAETFAPLPGARPMPELPSAAAGRQRVRGLWAGGVAVAAFALGLLVAPLSEPLFGERGQDWRQAVAEYQVLYTEATVAELAPTAAEVDQALARAAAQVGLPDLTEMPRKVAGFELKRVQVLGFEDAPLIQMVFVGPTGLPLALCLMGGDAGGHGAAMRAGLSSESWGTGSHQFLLIGDLAQERLSALAARFHSATL